MNEEENICTKEHPYRKGLPGRWQHPDAIEIDTDYGGSSTGDYEKYECPNCGKTFWIELPG